MTGHRHPRRSRGDVKANATIKTEIRALDVLELFSQGDGELHVGDVVRSLRLPQSSASRLLAQLSDAGYLAYDRVRRTYRSGIRSAFLGANAVTRIFGTDAPFRMVEELRGLSSAPIMLTTRNQTRLVIIHIDQCGNEPGEPCFHIGYASALISSASGSVLLSAASDTLIQALVRRYNAEVDDDEERVLPDTFMASVGKARRDGYLIQPVEAAVRGMGNRCRCVGSIGCAVSCCLAQRGSHLVAPIAGRHKTEVAAIISIPDGDGKYHGDLARQVRGTIAKYSHDLSRLH